MKLNRSFITSEDDSKLFWGGNDATMYAVVNKDVPNQYGEYPGYRIMPSKPLPFCFPASPCQSLPQIFP